MDASYSSGVLAVSALLSTMDRTPKAAKRCAAWMDRARGTLRGAGDPLLAAAAITQLEKACGICGLCRKP
jgi:hypothetical protein